jgi:hypothetical protein
MSFKIQPIENDKWELVFFSEPSYITALPMDPESIEPELMCGIWLIVVFPVWSRPVIDSVNEAISCVKFYDGCINLGVRPFDGHEWIYKWWPSQKKPLSVDVLQTISRTSTHLAIHLSSDSSSIPLWLAMVDGHVRYQGAGPRSKKQLSEMIQGIISDPLCVK